MKPTHLSVLVSLLVLVLASISPFDSPDFCLQIITPTCNTTFSYIDELNAIIRPTLLTLVQTPFFRYFKLDLDKQCHFWNAQHFCATKNCAVETLPEQQYNWSGVPDEFRPSKLGEIARDAGLHDEAKTCEDIDYCHIDDDHNCVFVDLVANPERFTGYGGAQSFEVWKAIYSENCFPNTNPMSMAEGSEPEQCVEKNLFYRLVSGMHASIAVHLLNEYLDPETEHFGPNLKIFMERVGKFNDRLANIYFNYALVSQAVVKLHDLMTVPEYITDEAEDAGTTGLMTTGTVRASDYSDMLEKVTSQLKKDPLFETHQLFDPNVVHPQLKEEFRARFRNVSAIMDCVGCDRCRMWGKVQTIGYGTAFKILFELEDPTTQHLFKVRRIELVALFNTFDRLSKSIASINNFKKMYLEHLEDVAAGRAKHGDYEPQHGKGIEFPFVPWTPKAKPPQTATEEKTELSEEPRIYYKDGELKKPLRQQQGFYQELEDFMLALKFIWQSYKDFPSTIYRLVVYYASGWWNVYIGKAVYVPSSQLDTSQKDEL